MPDFDNDDVLRMHSYLSNVSEPSAAIIAAKAKLEEAITNIANDVAAKIAAVIATPKTEKEIH